jgi:hypothetical protein
MANTRCVASPPHARLPDVRQRDLDAGPRSTSMRHPTRQVFGEVAEGWDTVERINESFVDDDGRPLQNIRCVRREKRSLCDEPPSGPTNRVAMLPLLWWKLSSVQHGLSTVSSIRWYWTTRWTTLPDLRRMFPTPRQSSNASKTTPGLRTIGCPVKTRGLTCDPPHTEPHPLHPCALRVPPSDIGHRVDFHGGTRFGDAE